MSNNAMMKKVHTQKKRIRMFMEAGMPNEYRDIKSFQLINLTKLLLSKEKSMEFPHTDAKGNKKVDKIVLKDKTSGHYTLGAIGNKPAVTTKFVWFILPSHDGTMSNNEKKEEQKRRNNRNKKKSPKTSVKKSPKKSVKTSPKKSVKTSPKKSVKKSK